MKFRRPSIVQHDPSLFWASRTNFRFGSAAWEHAFSQIVGGLARRNARYAFALDNLTAIVGQWRTCRSPHRRRFHDCGNPEGRVRQSIASSRASDLVEDLVHSRERFAHVWQRRDKRRLTRNRAVNGHPVERAFPGHAQILCGRK